VGLSTAVNGGGCPMFLSRSSAAQLVSKVDANALNSAPRNTIRTFIDVTFTERD
jgi:hypothetical protein